MLAFTVTKQLFSGAYKSLYVPQNKLCSLTNRQTKYWVEMRLHLAVMFLFFFRIYPCSSLFHFFS